MAEVLATENTLVDSVFGKDNPGVSQTLITALTNFIVPLIQGDTTVLAGIGADSVYAARNPIMEDPPRFVGGAVRSGSGPTMEAQDLLKALKRFTESLVYSRKAQQEEHNSPENSDQLQEVSTTYSNPMTDSATLVGPNTYAEIQLSDKWDRHLWQSSGLGLISPGGDPKRESLINEIMDEARKVVFSKMPIRLLMFDPKGKEIKLVERSEVLHYIFLDVFAETFNAGEFRSALIFTDDRKAYIQDFIQAGKFGKYAILSHTWLPSGEVTYSDWRNQNNKALDVESPGYVKLAKFCKVAANYGCCLAWMDTVCINKESSSELDESIRSMFKWYRRAKVCIAYLAETTSLDDMDKDKWFTRGWTLQELLAPICIKFYASNWTAIADNPDVSGDLDITSDKWERDTLISSSLLSMICKATGLTKEELCDSPYFLRSREAKTIPIWRKMEWAANRKVTREEDAAYSLMGIFNVSMPTGYGEGGEHAFLRLVREILSSKSTSVSKLEIANWGSQLRPTNGDYYRALDALSSSVLIPASPRFYVTSSGSRDVHFYPPSVPITLSHLGICVPVLLMPAAKELSESKFPEFSPKGDYSATFQYVEGTRSYSGETRQSCKLLDDALFSSKALKHRIRFFAVLNIAEKAAEVLLPEIGPCLAIEVLPNSTVDRWTIPEGVDFERNLTARPVTFDIVCHNNLSSCHWQIPKDELNRHGMTLRTIYL